MERWFAERPVGDLLPGDHAWLAYADADEQRHVVGSFLRRGLLTADMVVCVTDASPRELPGLRGLDLDARVRSGQLSVLSRADACLTRGAFDPDRMAAALEGALARAEGERFRGVRIAADLTWAVRERHDLHRMLACEERVESAVAPSTMAMAICQVDRRVCPGRELTALGDRHEVLVGVDPDFDDGVLSITRTYRPRGLKLAGELDRARHTVFAEALNTVTEPGGEVHLDVAGLRSVDLGALSIMSGAWLDMRPHGRLVLDAPSPRLTEVVELVGAGMLPGLELGVAGEPRPGAVSRS